MTKPEKAPSLKAITDATTSGLPQGVHIDTEKLGSIPEKLFSQISFAETANKTLKNFDTPTITTQLFDGSKDATAFIKKLDPSNLSGTVSFGLNIADMVKKKSGAFKSPLSVNMSSMLTKLASGSFPELDKLIGQLSELENKLEELQNQLNAPIQEIENLQNQISDLVKKVDMQ